MPKQDPLSLDQLQVLLSVVETGSFAGAARRLQRATSAISYAIDTLESQLGVSLFDRDATRPPKLSPAGQAVVAEARCVTHSAQRLRARVKGLREGLESELSLVVDAMFPRDKLVDALNTFRARFPSVPLRLKLEVLEQIDRSLHSGAVDMAIGGSFHMKSDGLQCIQLAGVELIPVAAPGHPLVVVDAATPGATREHLQLVLSGPSEDAREYGVVAGNVWRVGDLTSKHALLLGGIGWGGMPEWLVRPDLEAGRLVRLQVLDWRGTKYALQVTYRNDSPPGPAGQWLIEYLLEHDS